MWTLPVVLTFDLITVGWRECVLDTKAVALIAFQSELQHQL